MSFFLTEQDMERVEKALQQRITQGNAIKLDLRAIVDERLSDIVQTVENLQSLLENSTATLTARLSSYEQIAQGISLLDDRLKQHVEHAGAETAAVLSCFETVRTQSLESACTLERELSAFQKGFTSLDLARTTLTLAVDSLSSRFDGHEARHAAADSLFTQLREGIESKSRDFQRIVDSLSERVERLDSDFIRVYTLTVRLTVVFFVAALAFAGALAWTILAY